MKIRYFFMAIISAVFILAGVMSAFAKTEHSHKEKTFRAKPGGMVVVDLSFQDVEVRITEGRKIHIVSDLEVTASGSKAERLIEKYTPDIEQHGSNYIIKTPDRVKGIKFNFGRMSMKGRVTIDMPPGLDLEVDLSSGNVDIRGDLGKASVNVDLSSGNVELDGALEKMNVDISSGNTEVSLTRPARNVSIDSSSGNIRFRGPAEAIDFDSSSGSIHAEGLTGDAELDASSGSIQAGWDSASGGTRIRADSSSGSITLFLPGETVIEGNIETSSGRITSDFPGKYKDKDEKSYRFEGGKGAIRLDANASSGSVKVLKP